MGKPDLGAGMFFRLFLGTCAMLSFGYSGEAHFLNAWAGFLFGLSGWAFILFEIFAGEAGKESAALGGNVKTAFDIMKFIVTVGWSIYPLGYFFGYLQSGVDDSTLNLVYNLADFVNKIAFCLAIWQSAKNSTLSGEPHCWLSSLHIVTQRSSSNCFCSTLDAPSIVA